MSSWLYQLSYSLFIITQSADGGFAPQYFGHEPNMLTITSTRINKK
jgi:hypothetical protein